MEQLAERPPYVRFETKSLENRQASIEAGHYVGTDIDFAYITPAGSKDVIERNVKEWLEQLDQQVLQERINPAWRDAFKGMYRAYKEGKEAPLVGMPILDWPGLSPSQVKQLVSINLRAVEDVAAMNEETIARLGMGGRALKDRAVEYLRAAKDVGSVAEASAALKVENEELKRRSTELELQVKQLAAQMAVFSQAQANVMQRPAPATESITADDLGLGDPL